VGISNIDPHTQECDIKTTYELRSLIPGHIRVMVMDGIRTPSDFKRLSRMSLDAIMVEASLLEAQPSVAAMRTLLNGAKP
jgi:indole-3-glycerol phosphate synthase